MAAAARRYTNPLKDSPIENDNLQCVPDSFFDFKRCFVKRLICIDLMDRCLLKFQVGASGMPSTYVVLWFFFAAGRIP